jgi:hypothetical protein
MMRSRASARETTSKPTRKSCRKRTQRNPRLLPLALDAAAALALPDALPVSALDLLERDDTVEETKEEEGVDSTEEEEEEEEESRSGDGRPAPPAPAAAGLSEEEEDEEVRPWARASSGHSSTASVCKRFSVASKWFAPSYRYVFFRTRCTNSRLSRMFTMS